MDCPGPPAPELQFESRSNKNSKSDSEKSNTNDIKIRKYFPETWLWNTTSVGYTLILINTNF